MCIVRIICIIQYNTACIISWPPKDTKSRKPRVPGGRAGQHDGARRRTRQLQLGDEEQIDERLARRAHDLEGRLAKLGAPGIQRPKDLLEFVNNLKHKSVGGQQLETVQYNAGPRYTVVLYGRGWLYYVLYVLFV